MHPQIQQNHPGNCPICGMTLELKTMSAVEEESPELADMTRRFWIGGVLALPVFLLGLPLFVVVGTLLVDEIHSHCPPVPS